MTRPLVFLLALALTVFAFASCSFTTAGNFKECTADVDCGTLAACSSGYCLPLPNGCRREEAGGTRKAFEEPNRIPLVALLPITGSSGELDDSEVQSANAIKLAISEANDRLSTERGFFGLFVCNTGAPDASLSVQGPWFINNLKAPAMFVSSSGPTQTMALDSTRKDAGTLIISPNATNPELTTLFSNDGNVWRVAPPDNFQAEVMSRLVQMDLDAGARVAILAPTTAYGQGFGNPLKELLTTKGYTAQLFPYVRNDEQTPTRETAVNGVVNLLPHATVLIGGPADVVFIIERAKLFTQLTRADGHRWYLTDSAKDPATITPTTRSEFEGAVGTAPAQGTGDAYPTFRDVFRTRYGVDPDTTNFVSHSYDAAWLVMLAAQFAEGTPPDAKKITGRKLAEGMAKMSLASGPPTQLRADKWAELANGLSMGTTTNVEGTSGPLDLNLDAGFAMSDYEVWQVRDGGIRVLRYDTP